MAGGLPMGPGLSRPARLATGRRPEEAATIRVHDA